MIVEKTNANILFTFNTKAMDSQTHVQMKAIIDNLVAQKKNRLKSAKQDQEKQTKAANTELVIPSQPNRFERFLESKFTINNSFAQRPQ